MIYRLTLTGAANGTSDIDLPISSFTLRLRDSTKSSYLSCVVPNVSKYGAEIVARVNGSLVLTADWPLITCPLTDIRKQRGGNRSSTTLTGYTNVSNPVPGSHTIQRASYVKDDPAGTFRLRTALYQALAGDTFTFESVTRTIDTIAISVNANQTQMEISGV